MPSAKLAEVTTTKLIAIRCDEPLQRAAEVMMENGIRHLPVVNAAGIVIGIISDRDLLRASVPIVDANGLPVGGRLRFLSDATVLGYMSSALRAVAPDASVQEAIDIMLREKVSSCLVVDDRKVVGIITYEDMMDLLKDYLHNPKGSLRSTISNFIATSPLGPISTILAQAGI